MKLLEARAIIFSCPAGVDELAGLDPQLDELRAAGDVYDDAGAIGPRFWGESAYVLHALSRIFCSCYDGDWEAAPN